MKNKLNKPKEYIAFEGKRFTIKVEAQLLSILKIWDEHLQIKLINLFELMGNMGSIKKLD